MHRTTFHTHRAALWVQKIRQVTHGFVGLGLFFILSVEDLVTVNRGDIKAPTADE